MVIKLTLNGFDQHWQQFVPIQCCRHFLADVIDQAKLSGFLAFLFIKLCVLNGHSSLRSKERKDLDVFRSKGIELRTFDVQHADESFPNEQWHSDLRTPANGSLNVTSILAHIRNVQGPLLLGNPPRHSLFADHDAKI